MPLTCRLNIATLLIIRSSLGGLSLVIVHSSSYERVYLSLSPASINVPHHGTMQLTINVRCASIGSLISKTQ